MRAILSIVEKPLTGSNGSAVMLADVAMRVPRAWGLKVLRIQMGMSRAIAGAMVCGWTTLAPK